MNKVVYKPEGERLFTEENIFYTSSISNMEKAIEKNLILEGKATLCDTDKNLIINFGEFRGIIPREECVLQETEKENRDIAVITRVNKPVCFCVREIREQNGEKIAVLSRKDAQKFALDEIMKLPKGTILDGKITHLEPFGAFVDIGCGIVSLITIDSISVSRIPHPEERFYRDQKIKCIIKDIDKEKERIYLSHKELLGTWDQNADLFSPGQTVSGIVRSIEDYGVFIELTPNFAGLSDLVDGIKEGDHAAVYIKNIIPEKMKVKLTIVDFFDSPCEEPVNNYFITSGQIKKWRYSSEKCSKVIETDFE
ncbi:MAG: S1 RNA-binding domain-containing protein [Clostridia bacterium]|nr:S1 RNA-binding domain-containing protein [Clostridia bacterium]